MNIINYLKQARKNASLSLQDVAHLLEMDVSNLSKYERGIKTPTLQVILGYHIITKIPLSELFGQHILTAIDSISKKLTQFITRLEEEVTSPKMEQRIASLYEVLNTISCLKDVSENNHEKE
ncbi:HTH-type transcriptional regulator ImmR [Polaribacter huanghezhanensis]|uniref:helix-turn-helix domain-containing protein n=1 Tax=Polaribacter huanghezhanensis TaxID=1354726 RepID=UPI002646FD5D|nr:helix-turn-helix transcriptional regulator [Polaribacter huanghezhanensis]WKD85213.1 HTH-type transcriptional regulator ImmR [Polaribacter huanghezhanensis]